MIRWIDKASKLSETQPVQNSFREGSIFGVKMIFKIKQVFLHRDENGHVVYLAIHEDFTQTNKLEMLLNNKQKHLDELEITNKWLKQFFDSAPLYMGVMRLVKNNTDTRKHI